jgi:ATP-binding cassette subfamily B (MDR/TAP) protein 1
LGKPHCFLFPKVLKGVNLTVEKGKTVALVGQSGCGKSTIIQLTQRFYDPCKGSVFVDDEDVRNLHLHSLRERYIQGVS